MNRKDLQMAGRDIFFLFWHKARQLEKVPGACLSVKSTIYNKISKQQKKH